MMAVAVVFGAGESRDQNVGAKSPNHAHHVGERHVVASPFLESFFGGLRIAEVGDAGEALLDSVVFVGGEEFEGAQDSEFVEESGAEFVLSAFAASEGEE